MKQKHGEARVNDSQSAIERAGRWTLAAGGSDFDGNPVVGPALACTAAAQRVTGRQQMWTENSKTSQEAVATNLTTIQSASRPRHGRMIYERVAE